MATDYCHSYRKHKEVQEFRKTKDPLIMSRDRMLATDLASREELDGIDKEIRTDIKEAVKFAMAGSVLPEEEMYTDIFVNTPEFPVRGCDPFTWGRSQVAST